MNWTEVVAAIITAIVGPLLLFFVTRPKRLNPQVPPRMETPGKQQADRPPDLTQFAQAFSTPPKTKEQWFNEGKIHYDAKRYEEALVAFEQAIFLDPTVADCYTYKARTLHFLGHPLPALVVRKQAIERDPKNGWRYHLLGVALLELKQYPEALINFEQCIQNTPSYFYAYYAKCRALYELQRYKEALEAIERFLRLAPLSDPWYALGCNYKGHILHRLGKPEEAKLAFQEGKQQGKT